MLNDRMKAKLRLEQLLFKRRREKTKRMHAGHDQDNKFGPKWVQPLQGEQLYKHA